jgi:glycosyltransferase involved in cell wall biosynthesis
MKIAIVEWWPRLCGAVNWAIHLSGAETHHEVDLLTFSKSGKKLKPWEKVVANWQVHKISEAVQVLNSYDLVILSDIVCRAPETRPKVEGELPWYLTVMQQVKTPWTTMIHDGSYAGKESAVMLAMLQTPSFNKTLITTRFKEAQARIDKLEGRPSIDWVVDPYLPYDLKKAVGKVPPLEQRTNEIIHIGRSSTNKGQDVLLDLFRDLNCNVHSWGYSAYGKPSHAWLLWELATQHLGLLERRFPVRSKVGKHPQMHKFYTRDWAVRKLALGLDLTTVPLESVYDYHGGYLDFDEIDWSPLINVALTNDGWKGTLEYATLDAIAHGCVAVVPQQQIEYADYITLVTIPYRRCSYKVKPGTPLGGTRDWDRDKIIETLNDLVARPAEELEALANMQYDEVMVKHDPARILNLIVEANRV